MSKTGHKLNDEYCISSSWISSSPHAHTHRCCKSSIAAGTGLLLLLPQLFVITVRTIEPTAASDYGASAAAVEQPFGLDELSGWMRDESQFRLRLHLLLLPHHQHRTIYCSSGRLIARNSSSMHTEFMSYYCKQHRETRRFVSDRKNVPLLFEHLLLFGTEKQTRNEQDKRIKWKISR